MTNPVCPRCSDYADHPDALTCPTCSYWPLRIPSPQERLDHLLATRRIRVTTKREAA